MDGLIVHKVYEFILQVQHMFLYILLFIFVLKKSFIVKNTDSICCCKDFISLISLFAVYVKICSCWSKVRLVCAEQETEKQNKTKRKSQEASVVQI